MGEGHGMGGAQERRKREKGEGDEFGGGVDEGRLGGFVWGLRRCCDVEYFMIPSCPSSVQRDLNRISRSTS